MNTEFEGLIIVANEVLSATGKRTDWVVLDRLNRDMCIVYHEPEQFGVVDHLGGRFYTQTYQKALDWCKQVGVMRTRWV